MTFKISENIIKERKKSLILMTIFMPIMVIAFFLLYAGQNEPIENMGLVVMILAGISLFLVLEVIIVGKMMFKRIRSIILNFDEKGFTRINGKKTERFEFHEMTYLKITKKEGHDQKMIIRGKSANRAFVLGGYDNMSEMKALFETSVKTITQKEQKIDWTSPLVMMLSMGSSFLFLALLIIVNDQIMDFVSPLFQLILGIYFVTFKPVSRSSGARFKIFEYIMAALLIFTGGAIIIIRLLELY